MPETAVSRQVAIFADQIQEGMRVQEFPSRYRSIGIEPPVANPIVTVTQVRTVKQSSNLSGWSLLESNHHVSTVILGHLDDGTPFESQGAAHTPWIRHTEPAVNE